MNDCFDHFWLFLSCTRLNVYTRASLLTMTCEAVKCFVVDETCWRCQHVRVCNSQRSEKKCSHRCSSVRFLSSVPRCPCRSRALGTVWCHIRERPVLSMSRPRAMDGCMDTTVLCMKHASNKQTLCAVSATTSRISRPVKTHAVACSGRTTHRQCGYNG